MGKITNREQKLLDSVIAFTGDDESKLRAGIIHALQGIDKFHGRQYLWNLLRTKATAKIRCANKKAAEQAVQPNQVQRQIRRPQFALTS